MKLALLAAALTAAVAATPSPVVLPSAPAPAPVAAPADSQAAAALPATTPVPPATAQSAVPSQPAASATEREVDRLARLAADDASRALDTTVRNAPGRNPAEVGGLRRCVDASGASVFTDRACDSIAATDAPPDLAIAPAASARIINVRSCARHKSDLLDGVRSALEVHDVNRLADYYHWTGMDGAEGYRLMDRLEAFAKRPFVDAQLVSSRTPPPVADFGDSIGLLSRPMLADPTDPGAPGVPADARFTRPRPADLLRVDQMRSDKDAASQVTWFRLRSNAGCWWMQY